MKNRSINFYLIALASMFVWLLVQSTDPTLFRDHVESKTYDLRLHLRNFFHAQPSSDEIVIVVVDEDSLAEIGRWPWSRTVMADLVDRVASYKPRAIGIDIMFSEKESPEADGRLAEAIRKAGNVVLAMPFIVATKEEEARAPTPAPDYLWDSTFMQVKAVSGIDWKSWAVSADRVIPPIEEIAKGAVLGHVTSKVDSDGVIRSEILSVNYGDDCYPSLALQVARVALGVDAKDMVLYGGSSVKIADRIIPTDLSSQVIINYRGGAKSYRYLSAAGILKGRSDAKSLQGKIVLIGTSALATFDQKITPFSGNLPGVEKNANVVQNILDNNFIRKSPGVVELVAILLTSLTLIITLPRLTAMKGVLLGFGLIGGYFTLANIFLFYQNIWINLVSPVANMLIIVATQTTTKLFSEEKRANEIRKMFSSYVSPKIVEVLVNNPEKAYSAGNRSTVTILFSDIIGFTTLSEKLAPEEVVAMLNEYFHEMAETIFFWEGTLDKFVGDEIMALWGAPTDQPNHAELALRCALNMSDRLVKLQEKWHSEGKMNIDCGIGINTGEVVIGNIGWLGKKMDYTAIGNNVNIAARVEKLTRQYGTRILITGNTLEMVKPVLEQGLVGHVEITAIEMVNLRGKDEGVMIYSVKSLPSDQELPAS